MDGTGADFDERECLRQARAGDGEALDALVRRHQAQVYRSCLALLRDPHDAQDAAQAAFIKGLAALGSFRGESGLATWLTRIALNCCRDLLRAKRRRPLLSLDAERPGAGTWGEALADPRPLPGEGAEDLDGRAERLLAALEPEERDLLRSGLEPGAGGQAALARRLGLSLDALKGRLKRIRQRLRKAGPKEPS